MQTLENKFRAPACERKTGQDGMLPTMLQWLIWPFTRCWHRNTTRPYLNQQGCLDCGSSREYRYTSDGVYIGKWRKPEPPAVATRCTPDGRGAVLNPGTDSGLFTPRPRLYKTSIEKITASVDEVAVRHMYISPAEDAAVQL